MSIASEITRIKQNIVNAYNACLNKGATMPDIQNSENLAETILSIVIGSASNATEEQINSILQNMKSTINEDGHLVIDIPDDVDIDFYLDSEGNLIVEEDYSNIEFELNNNNLEVHY